MLAFSRTFGEGKSAPVVRDTGGDSGIPLLVGCSFFLAVLALQVQALLSLNGGHFAFTIDDPYIHLAQAENIAQGHYGLNPGEPAAPSSGFLWPFLLAPFASSLHAPWVIVGLNAVCSLITLAVVDRGFSSCVAAGFHRAIVLRSVALVAFVLATNLVGLVLTGMEHSLQVLLACGVCLGLCDLARGRPIPWGFTVCTIMAPLVRYENLAIVAAAACMLWLQGLRRMAMGSLMAIGAGLGLFSMFLVGLGLSFLPTSVRAKLTMGQSTSLHWMLVKNLQTNLETDRGTLFAASLITLVGVALWARRRSMRRLAACMSLALGLHLLFGQFGWANRYEIYLWACTLMTLATVATPDPERFRSAGGSVARACTMIFLVVLAFCQPYLANLKRLPVAANNIHEQHYQAHRFAVDHLAEKVAANDIGYLAWRNPEPVLDLYGLGCERTLALRAQASQRPDWLRDLVAREGARAALVYEHWYEDQIPGDWVRIGRLRLSRENVFVAGEELSFFATDAAYVQVVRDAATNFVRDLPAGVVFAFD